MTGALHGKHGHCVTRGQLRRGVVLSPVTAGLRLQSQGRPFTDETNPGLMKPWPLFSRLSMFTHALLHPAWTWLCLSCQVSAAMCLVMTLPAQFGHLAGGHDLLLQLPAGGMHAVQF